MVLDGAISVIRISLAIAAGLLVLWIIGVGNDPHAHGMTAVGVGLDAVFRALGDLLGAIHF